MRGNPQRGLGRARRPEPLTETIPSSWAVAHSPAAYREFVRGSKAEFGVAKSGYVESRCGWFSDRSACYLAAGRPVITEDTGFGKFLPTGEGLFAFSTTDDAAAGVEEVERDYPRHSRAAREIAHEYFAAERVVGSLLERAGPLARLVLRRRGLWVYAAC